MLHQAQPVHGMERFLENPLSDLVVKLFQLDYSDYIHKLSLSFPLPFQESRPDYIHNPLSAEPHRVSPHHKCGFTVASKRWTAVNHFIPFINKGHSDKCNQMISTIACNKLLRRQTI